MNVLFINSAEPNCGVHQFGISLFRNLRGHQGIDFSYLACKSEFELFRMMEICRPEIVLFNFYPCTMPWLSLHTLNAVRNFGAKPISIYHEVRITGFDALIYPDPTFAGDYRNLTQWFPMGRPLPYPAEETTINHGFPVISTSGFGFTWKGHERLTQMVVDQFECATLRLHLPFAKYGDADGAQARAVADRCRAIVAGSTGIRLLIDHEFMEPDQFVAWLAESDLNAYLYDEADTSRGIASTTDHALAARRPIAITRTRMFRHLHSVEGIFVEENTLPEILAGGIEPLRGIYQQFSKANIQAEIEDILKSVSREKFCRLLTNKDRERLVPVIDEMKLAASEMMSRKIPEANVQQAWTVEMVRRTRAKSVLCVGAFEDSGCELLRLEIEHVIGIDAAWDVSLERWRKQGGGTFECVFATSVIEHVPDDGQFIRDLCDCLTSDGTCILTCDFKEGWQKGQPLPASDQRLYTSADIERIERILTEKGCYFVDKPDTSGAPDFHYQGHDYSFLGLIFKKL